MTVRWTEDAAEDLLEISDYLRPQDPNVANRVCGEPYSAAGDLATMPERGRLRAASSLRELVVSRLGYILFYRVETDFVTIVRILHGARSWRPE